ncbi:MAG: hypothetical protein KJ065_26885 [Anaerolineae bacterium]|nr:hypothetical protein [Anaerolineae bacterium]
MHQLTIPQMTAYLSEPNRRGIGRIGEELVYRKLRDANLQVSFAHHGEQRGDLIARTLQGEVIRVEVKTARRNCARKWCFTLEKNGHTSITHSDVLILLCITASGDFVPFVIPVSDVIGRRHIVITSEPEYYSGRFARYRQHRNSVDLEVAPCPAF